MMKIFLILSLTVFTLFAASEKYFMVHFGKYRLNEYTKAEKLWQTLRSKGIESELYQDEKQNVVVVKSTKPLRYAQIKDLGMDLKEIELFPVPGTNVSHKTQNDATDKDAILFGNNPTLVHLMEEGLDFRQKLAQTKARYIALQKRKVEKTGLSLDLEAERALERERNGYTAEINWDLLHNGYLGSRKEAERKALEKSISFEKMTQKLIDDYSRVATYEIEDIKQHISYIFANKKVQKAKSYVNRAKKKLNKGLITKWEYNKVAVMYHKYKTELEYLSSAKGKPFSRKYYALIKNIEKSKLLENALIYEHTLKNAPSLKMEKQRTALLSESDDWRENIKAQFFLGRKQYTFIRRDETLAGLEVRIPLEYFGEEEELTKLEKIYSEWKQKSTELLLRKEIDNLTESLGEYKEQISRINKEIDYRRQQLSLLERSLTQTTTNPEDKWVEHMKLIDLEKELWLKRADILSALLKLQYLSGIRVL